MTDRPHPITHEPHSQVVYMPGPYENRIRITLSVCDEGRCLMLSPGKLKFVKPPMHEFALIPFDKRYRAAGMDAHIIPGIHWWEDTPEYRWCQYACWIKLAEHEGRLSVAASMRQTAAELQREMRNR